MPVRSLTLEEFAATLAAARPPVVLDVRDLLESEQGRMPGATLLPRRRIEFRIATLVHDLATPLVVVDSGDDVAGVGRDPRAVLAAATLVALGYRDVATLQGGFGAWRARGLPVVSGVQVSSQAFGRSVPDLAQVPRIDVATLRRWQGEGRRVALCDVRPAEEHTLYCIPGAVSLPGFEAASHALDMATESDVIVLCSGARTRSLIVARTLVDMGLGDIFALEGGVLAWSLEGLAFERGSRRRRVRPSRTAQQFARLGAARLAKHCGIERIEPSELSALLYAAHGNFHAFDLRSPASHRAAHVPRSVSVAQDILIIRHEELIADPAAPVVLIDDDAIGALLTGVWLRRVGIRHVKKLAGGFAGWLQSGRPASAAGEMPLGWVEASAVTPGLGPDDVAGWLAAYGPAHVLHVDTAASFRRGHVPGATWLPRGWLEPRIGALAPRRDEALLLTCTDGAQAAFAAATLRRLGYVHVAWLQGGTRIWSASGRELESSAPAAGDDQLVPPRLRGRQALREYLG